VTEAWSYTENNVGIELIVAKSGCIPVVQAAADVVTITERAEASLWLNMYVRVKMYPCDWS
jgi:hypothetical protein